MLRETLDSCMASIAWTDRAVTEGVISSSTARERNASVSKAQTNIKIRAGLHEMEHLRELVARQEAAALAVRKAEIASRKTGGDDVSEYDAELEPGTN